MAHTRISATALALAALLCAAAAPAQSVLFDLAAGYQWLDVSGNEDMYKSQVNEDDGLVLSDLSLLVVKGKEQGALFDRLRIDAADFGASPQSRLRLQATRHGVLDLRGSYFRAKHYSALPTIANPFLGAGVAPGQHTISRTLESLDLDLELRPGRSFTPLVGYSWHRYEGPATTTFHVGQDEFKLDSKLDETSSEFRAGFGFHVGTFHGSVLHGRRSVDSSDKVTLAATSRGNNGRPVLDHDVTLTHYERSARTEMSSPVTTANLTGTFGDHVRVVGSFVTTGAEADTNESETLAGDLVSFELRRFFGGRQGGARSSTDNPAWRGQARIEADLSKHLQFVGGYTQRHRELDGAALITELYLNTVNFSGALPRDLTEVIDASNALRRDDDAVEVAFNLHDLGPFRVWAGWTGIDQNLAVSPAAAEIVVPGGQGGEFDRHIDRTAAGVAFAKFGFDASLEWQREEANSAIMRSDLLDRDRWRARFGWGDGKYVRIMGNAELVDGEGADGAYASSADTRYYGADFEVTPSDKVSVRASYGKFETDTAYTTRRPETFALVPSLYTEDGELFEGAVAWKADRFGFDAGMSAYDSDGDMAFTHKRGWARFDLDFSAKVGASVLYDYRKYKETPILPLADYNAKRYAVLLRWHN